MIIAPEGWRQLSPVGDEVLARPDGAMQLRYRQRLAPIVRVATIIDAVLAQHPEWTTILRGESARYSTHEGEHAFGALVEGTWRAQPAERYIGVVVGDDAYNVLDAISLEPPGTLEPLGRHWVRSAVLELGVRRRRFYYPRPAGWHGHATGFVTHWFPRRYPARPTAIIVYPATPTHEDPTAVYDAVVRQEQSQGAHVEPTALPMPIEGRHGLRGTHWRMICGTSERVVHRDLVVLARRPYTYAIQLDAYGAPDEDARATLVRLANGAEPVPGTVGGAASLPAPDLLDAF